MIHFIMERSNNGRHNIYIKSIVKSTGCYVSTNTSKKTKGWITMQFLVLPIINPIRTKLVTSPWIAKFEKTFLENHNFAIPG